MPRYGEIQTQNPIFTPFHRSILRADRMQHQDILLPAILLVSHHERRRRRLQQHRHPHICIPATCIQVLPSHPCPQTLVRTLQPKATVVDRYLLTRQLNNRKMVSFRCMHIRTCYALSLTQEIVFLRFHRASFLLGSYECCSCSIPLPTAVLFLPVVSSTRARTTPSCSPKPSKKSCDAKSRSPCSLTCTIRGFTRQGQRESCCIVLRFNKALLTSGVSISFAYYFMDTNKVQLCISEDAGKLCHHLGMHI